MSITIRHFATIGIPTILEAGWEISVIMSSQKVVLVTGASSGIGQSIARLLAQKSFAVFAGYMLGGAIEETTVEEAKAQFETNFFGMMRTVKGAPDPAAAAEWDNRERQALSRAWFLVRRFSGFTPPASLHLKHTPSTCGVKSSASASRSRWLNLVVLTPN